nr:serine/threonine-protein kinase PknD [uncultured bacterium]
MSEHPPDPSDSSSVTTASSPARSGARDVDALRFGPGSVIDGRFEVEAVLGRGGMGYVLAARHRELDERVAVKLLLPGEASAGARRRLLQEAQNAVRIRSEHSVRILDVVGTGPAAPYIVMELLDGESLHQRLSRNGGLPVRQVVDVVLQACEAVGEAHARGIVHRDLKPSNLFLVDKTGSGPFVKVLDFGVSKRFGSDAAHELTQSRALLGSPVYAPPEQLRASRKVDRRADIWSLGVILYQGVTQRLPFRGDTLAEVCTRILQDSPPEPRALRPDVPEALELTILRCLEKQPARRFATVQELALSLREFAPATAARTLIYLDSLGAASTPGVVEDVDTDEAPASGPATLVEPVVTSMGGRRRRFVLGAGLLLAVAGTAALGYRSYGTSGNRREPDTGAQAPASTPSLAGEIAVPATSELSRGAPEAPAPAPSVTVSAGSPAPSAHPQPSTPAPPRPRPKTSKRPSGTQPSTASHPWVTSR